MSTFTLPSPCALSGAENGKTASKHQVGKLKPTLLAAPRKKYSSRRGGAVVYSSLGGVSALDTSSVVAGVAQAASALAWVGAAYFGFKVVEQDATRDQQRGSKECPRCEGTGFVECYCTRWSDGDKSGCGTCRGSRRMACNSCGGGGLAVPIAAKLYIKNEKDYTR